MRRRIVFVFMVLPLLFLNSCSEESREQLPGEVTFSFKRSVQADFSGNKVQTEATPAFVSYTIKKGNATLSAKIELFEFSGDFVTAPQQLPKGHYTLEQFLILDADNHAIFATPVQGSELADLVDHPLPLPFDVSAEETTEVVPEVLAVEDQTPAQFGYVRFGFTVRDKFDYYVNATIADGDSHPSFDYTLEIIAKDAPLGNVQWTKTVAMTAQGEIHIPAKYEHYTFRAVKEGYVPHVQHFLKEDLPPLGHLYFEFLPVELSEFQIYEAGGARLYTAKDPCKLFARLDLPEGYRLTYQWTDRNARDAAGTDLAEFVYYECFDIPICNSNNINLFGGTPYALLPNYCDEIDISKSLLDITLDDVIHESFFYFDTLPEIPLLDDYQVWNL